MTSIKKKKAPAKIEPLSLCNQRMLLLMEFIISNRINNVRSKEGFFRSIGLKSAANYTAISRGKQSFPSNAVHVAIHVYGLDANYFFYEDHLEMYKSGKEMSAIQQLQAATNRAVKELAARY